MPGHKEKDISAFVKVKLDNLKYVLAFIQDAKINTLSLRFYGKKQGDTQSCHP